MRGYFTDNIKTILGLKPSTANTTSTGQETGAVDTAGFDAVVFTAILGNTTGDATATLFVKGSTASGGTYQALSGLTVTTTTGQGDRLLQVDVQKPFPFPFLKASIARNAANSAHGGILVQQYQGKALPITASTDLAQSVVKGIAPTT